jgi:hypothetical protein
VNDLDRRYAATLQRARDDANVVGVVLLGSRAVDAFVTPRSDYDVFILQEAEDREGWPFLRGSGIETVSVTVERFEQHATYGSTTFWNRPAFLCARVELDRRNGGIAALVDAKRHLTREEADALAHVAISDYCNSLYRSLKNHRDGRTLAGRLDGLDTISPLLTTIFAVEGRVRPFNKWLAYEVGRAPLPLADLLPRLDGLARDPSAARQQALFRDVEPVVRDRGFGADIDDWAPDVELFRGAPAHRYPD